MQHKKGQDKYHGNKQTAEYHNKSVGTQVSRLSNFVVAMAVKFPKLKSLKKPIGTFLIFPPIAIRLFAAVK